MKKEFVCINCPLGCRLSVQLDGDTVQEVSGNRCKRGADYARQEAVCPMRVLTGNMRAQGCERPFSVRSSGPVPKSMLLRCGQELKKIHPPRPVRMGDVVIHDILGTGVDVIATRDT